MNLKSKQKKANRILYMTVVIILCVMAVIVGITTAIQRRRQPSGLDTTGFTKQTTEKVTTKAPKTEQTTETETTPEETEDVSAGVEDKLPEFIMPVAGTISKDHDESTLVYSLTMNDYRIHLGVDIASALGEAVLAAADGVISEVWDDPMMGKCVSIAHSGGALSIYKNLATELPEGIEAGAHVTSGQTIASIGESALIEIAEVPHVHYELKIDDEYVNPVDYFPASEVNKTVDTAYEG